jgi:hypothetical protein
VADPDGKEFESGEPLRLSTEMSGDLPKPVLLDGFDVLLGI